MVQNAKTKAPQGKPSGSQRGGSGLTEVNRKETEDKKIEDKYLDTEGQPGSHVKVRHENRNTDKVHKE